MSDCPQAPLAGRAFVRERLANIDRHFVHPPYLLESRLRERLAAGDLDSALALLREINNMARARLAGDRLRSLKNSLIASCTIFTRASIEGGADAELAFTLSDTFIKGIEAARAEEELREYEAGMLREFVDLVLRYREESRDVVVSRALRYVKAHIMREISLKNTAESLGLSEQYLSAQFSRKVGMSFVEYVQKLKVEEAKYFLRSTELSVMEIAQLFGFTYQAYFTRVFKKREGLTPTEYRRRCFQA